MRKLLRYRDIGPDGSKVVDSRQCLRTWIEKEGFPPGILIGPNTRAWYQDDIEAWLKSRPTARKAAPPAPKARNREAA